MSSNLVVIPTYNEKENIENIIRSVLTLSLPLHILIVEDGSPDGTADIVRKMQSEFSGSLFMIERAGKLGLGTAYIAGFRWALAHGYDYIFEMDADFSHNPADLPRLYDACSSGGADVAIGSRYVTGVNVVNWPIGRVLMSYFASKYVRFVLGMKIADTTAGFKCYRREVLETLELDKIRFKGYAFQIEMKFTAFKCGFTLKEISIIFINRELGVSKMNSDIFGEAFLGVIQLKISSWFRKFPQFHRRNFVRISEIDGGDSRYVPTQAGTGK
jgi:dolichol-phosphate mannosyltransferase